MNFLLHFVFWVERLFFFFIRIFRLFEIIRRHVWLLLARRRPILRKLELSSFLSSIPIIFPVPEIVRFSIKSTSQFMVTYLFFLVLFWKFMFGELDWLVLWLIPFLWRVFTFLLLFCLLITETSYSAGWSVSHYIIYSYI